MSHLLLTLFACLAFAQQDNPFNVLSGATLFTGPASPIIDLGYASYRGKDDSLTRTSNYLGMKYANAPRYDHATVFDGPVASSSGQPIDASDYGQSCAQQEVVSLAAPSDAGLSAALGFLESTPLLAKVLKQGEDCLSINVQRPRNQSLTDLPVMVFRHGGGFNGGSSSALLSETTAVNGLIYQGANIVKRSLDMNQPVVFVSLNYRLAHFGFMASKEFEDAGLMNLGLEDQRVGLRWIQKNIAKFGGDPAHVVITGESAGSWSVTGQLVANDGDDEGLFRGAIAMSGGPVNSEGGIRKEDMYNSLVKFVGCDTAANKIDCLRKAPYEKIYTHMQTQPYLIGYQSLSGPYTLRPGRPLLSQSPYDLASAGKMSKVPVLVGDMKDEGTLFSLINSLNTTTDEQVKDYFKTFWWPNATESQLDELLVQYPVDKGAPYDAALSLPLLPQFGRIASITGDYSFEVQRRHLLNNHQGKHWNYRTIVQLPAAGLASPIAGPLTASPGGLTEPPVLGSFHGADVALYLFGTLPPTASRNSLHIMSTFISFVNHLDPNLHGLAGLPLWPEWDQGDVRTYQFRESGVEVIQDDYRREAMDFLAAQAGTFKI